jgi:hypothetical protein
MPNRKRKHVSVETPKKNCTKEMHGFHPGTAGKLSSNLYDINQCQVYSEYTPDDGQRNCPKHVEVHAVVNYRNWFIWLVLL